MPTCKITKRNVDALQADEKDGSNAKRVGKLVDDVFASTRSDTDKQTALEAIKQVLGENIERGISYKDADKLKERLVHAIEKSYPSAPDKFSAFMDAVKKPDVGLTPNNPLVLYQRQKDTYIWDSELAGFGIKMTPAGRKVYLVQYRIAGRQSPTRRVTLGMHGTLTADQAREQARVILAKVSLGVDPAAEKSSRRSEKTIGELTNRYLEEHVKSHNKPSTAHEVERIIETKIKPVLGKYKINELTRAHVKAWHHDMRSKPYEANRALAYCSKMMSLAAGDWELRADNPCHGIKKFVEKKRERFFSDEELQRIGKAITEAKGNKQFLQGCVDAVCLLALTGCRVGEILSLKWDDIDISQGCIRLKEAKAGARTVPLGIPAITYLDGITQDGDYVVHGIDSDEPLNQTALRRFWDWVKTKAKVSDSRLHDFRHTAGTYAAQAGFNAFLVRDLLGHKSLAMTGRYVERSADPLRAAANTVSGRVSDAMNPANNDNPSSKN